MRKRKQKHRFAGATAGIAPAPQAARGALADPPFATAAALLLVAGLALYWGSLGYPLSFDDHHLLGHNLKAHFSGALSRLGSRWLSDASFWWVHVAFGNDLYWQRLANVLLHAATAVALCGFLARLFAVVLADAGGGGGARWAAFAGAVLFLLHPVAAYGVAYLIQRSIVLATLFSILALWCVLEGLARDSPRWYWGAVAAYLLALSAKEHAVMLPAVAVALAVLVRGASLALARRLALPLAALAALALYFVLRSRAYIGVYEPFAGDILGPRGVSPLEPGMALAYPLSVINQATLFFRYLLTWLLPWTGLMSVDIRTAFPRELLVWPQLAGFAAWLGYAMAAVWLLARRGRAGLVGFALLYPWLFSLTEFATVRAQEPFVLYRSYLWMSGLPAALAALSLPLAARGRAAILAAALAAVCAALIYSAHDRIRTFSSPFRLWDDAVRKNEGLSLPFVERAYLSRGLVHLDAQRLDAAAQDFEQALKLNPAWPDAWLGRGSLHLRAGRMGEARADFDRALELDPGYASAYGKRCIALTRLEGPAKGLADCEKAIKLAPADYEAWINLGALYHALQRPEDARASFERALEIAPSDPSAHYNYGVLLLELGRRDEAVRRHIQTGCDGGIPQACDILKRSRREP